MLFCPPLPPVRIEPGSAVTIGRHPACEFSLRRSDVSRRHAQILADGDRFTLTDLGSTNGTFLNGEPVEQIAALSPGDRIEIGANTVTFCWLDATLDEAAMPGGDAQTRIFDRTTARDAIRGEFAEVPPFAVLQVLEMGSMTGRLAIQGRDGFGCLWFRSGRPVHAETEKHCGFDAAVAIVNTERGEFHFESQELDTEETICASVTELLLEASRLFDEGEASGL